MMKSRELYVGASSDGRVVVWRFRKTQAMEYMAVQKNSDTLLVRMRDKRVVSLRVSPSTSPEKVASSICGAATPDQALQSFESSETCIESSAYLGNDPFIGAWDQLTQPPAEQAVFAPTATINLTTLEF